jgi:hypothetical protein
MQESRCVLSMFSVEVLTKCWPVLTWSLRSFSKFLWLVADFRFFCSLVYFHIFFLATTQSLYYTCKFKRTSTVPYYEVFTQRLTKQKITPTNPVHPLSPGSKIESSPLVHYFIYKQDSGSTSPEGKGTYKDIICCVSS